MKRYIPAILVPYLLMQSFGCSDDVTSPNYHLESEPSIINMQGEWRFNADFHLEHNTQLYLCEIIEAKLIVGQPIDPSDWPVDFEATLTNSKIVCKQGNSIKWEVPIDNMRIKVWRSILYAGIDFKLITPFDELSIECRAWEEIKEDSWNGKIFVDLPSTEIASDGGGTFTVIRWR